MYHTVVALAYYLCGLNYRGTEKISHFLVNWVVCAILVVFVYNAPAYFNLFGLHFCVIVHISNMPHNGTLCNDSQSFEKLKGRFLNPNQPLNMNEYCLFKYL